jgi:hypothetical protein
LLGENKVPAVDLDFFSGLLDIQDLVSERKPQDKLRDFFTDRLDDIKKLVDADGPAEVFAVARELFTGHLQDLRDTILPFIGRQFGITLSLITTLKNLPTVAVKDALRNAFLAYFFTKEGYITVDNLQLVAPVHLHELDLKQLGQVKALLSERTAERYLRDTIRLIVEAAGDVRYDNLQGRYHAMQQHMPNDDKKDKFANWFRGFSSVAESSVTGAVEEACLGVSTFQTNPLIAASISTFAGTAARKAAQHIFLSELEMLL